MKTIYASISALALLSCATLSAADRTAFDKGCKTCHGVDGKGNPAIAKVMKVEMKALGSKEIQAKTDGELKTVITKGAGKMKPVTSLSSGEVDQVIAFIRTLK